VIRTGGEKTKYKGSGAHAQSRNDENVLLFRANALRRRRYLIPAEIGSSDLSAPRLLEALSANANANANANGLTHSES
jgi:hypothetical protein